MKKKKKRKKETENPQRKKNLVSLAQHKDGKWWSGVSFWIQETDEVKNAQRSWELKEKWWQDSKCEKEVTTQVRSSWGYCRSLGRGAGALTSSQSSQETPRRCLSELISGSHSCERGQNGTGCQRLTAHLEPSNAMWSGIYPWGPAPWWSLNTKATALPPVTLLTSERGKTVARFSVCLCSQNNIGQLAKKIIGALQFDNKI